MGNIATGKEGTVKEILFRGNSMNRYTETGKQKTYRKPPNSSKYFKGGLQSLESGPIKRTWTADILDIHNPSKSLLCIRITDDLRFVEIVQINIYVQP